MLSDGKSDPFARLGCALCRKPTTSSRPVLIPTDSTKVCLCASPVPGFRKVPATDWFDHICEAFRVFPIRVPPIPALAEGAVSTTFERILARFEAEKDRDRARRHLDSIRDVTIKRVEEAASKSGVVSTQDLPGMLEWRDSVTGLLPGGLTITRDSPLPKLCNCGSRLPEGSEIPEEHRDCKPRKSQGMLAGPMKPPIF